MMESLVTHSRPFLANCSMLFTESPLLGRPEQARAAGFDAVEFWWPFEASVPADDEVNAFVSSISDAGVRLVALNFAAGDMPGGDRGLVSWPEREQEFRDSVEVALDICQRLGVVGCNALYGNRLEDASAEQQDEVADSNLAFATEAAARVGVQVLLEPVSGADQYPLLTAEDALRVIDRVEEATGTDNLRLLADFFHLGVNGDDIEAVLHQHTPRIGHIQIADAPGRGEPGTGELPLDDYITLAEQQGYEGWIGLEYKPTTSTLDGLDWLPRARRGVRSRVD